MITEIKKKLSSDELQQLETLRFCFSVNLSVNLYPFFQYFLTVFAAVKPSVQAVEVCQCSCEVSGVDTSSCLDRSTDSKTQRMCSIIKKIIILPFYRLVIQVKPVI